MERIRFDILMSAKPDCGGTTREPSLNEIIHKYYSAHFPAAEASGCTADYIEALAKFIGAK
jgi:hypothetical protein